jgi:hypothetical protein
MKEIKEEFVFVLPKQQKIFAPVAVNSEEIQNSCAGFVDILTVGYLTWCRDHWRRLRCGKFRKMPLLPFTPATSSRVPIPLHQRHCYYLSVIHDMPR